MGAFRNGSMNFSGYISTFLCVHINKNALVSKR